MTIVIGSDPDSSLISSNSSSSSGEQALAGTAAEVVGLGAPNNPLPAAAVLPKAPVLEAGAIGAEPNPPLDAAVPTKVFVDAAAPNPPKDGLPNGGGTAKAEG